MNFAKFLKTPLFTEHLWWLLLNEFEIFEEVSVEFDKVYFEDSNFLIFIKYANTKMLYTFGKIRTSEVGIILNVIMDWQLIDWVKFSFFIIYYCKIPKNCFYWKIEKPPSYPILQNWLVSWHLILAQVLYLCPKTEILSNRIRTSRFLRGVLKQVARLFASWSISNRFTSCTNLGFFVYGNGVGWRIEQANWTGD